MVKENLKVERRNPNIGKKQSRRPPNVEIHDYLYGYVDKQKNDIDELRKNQHKDFEQKRQSTKSKTIDKFLWDNMDKKLLPLFMAFDVDGDNRITNSDIEKVDINDELKFLMRPLFEEARLGNIDLSQKEFIQACKNLIKVVTFVLTLELQPSGKECYFKQALNESHE